MMSRGGVGWGGAAGCILKAETWNIPEGGMDEAPSLFVLRDELPGEGR